MFEIVGSSAKPMTMDLNGTFGSFKVPGSRFAVNYFSTFANPAAKDGHKRLVEELKPFRDRVDASELRNLASLLQRDLNDARVAEDLVPYLINKDGDVAFFPAILAVLIPKHYLLPESEQSKPYPKPVKTGFRTDFDGCWSIERYRDGKGTELPMGMLQVVLNEAEIVVLDGQHRANAFRFLSGDFDPQEEIYQMFYPPRPNVELSADLPVTIIWFESQSETPINPKLISRRLFVDVNNTAKPVSQARTILLDDRTATCIGTQQVYNRAAERGFASNQFSLLHGAFDMPVELGAAVGQLPRTALTAPEVVDETLRWAFFASTSYDNLDTWQVKRMVDQVNIARFNQIFPNVGTVRKPDREDTASGVRFATQPAANEFRLLFSSKFGPVLNELFEGLDFITSHYRACELTGKWIRDTASLTTQDMWKFVFCGGEGLYWIFRKEGEGSERGKNYRKAITEIEEHLSRERAALLAAEASQVDSAFMTVATKVFQVGFITAVDWLARHGDGEHLPAAAELRLRLNEFSSASWVNILTDFRVAVLGEGATRPRMWPSFRNIFLRMYDGGRGEIYDVTNSRSSPEYSAYLSALDRSAEALMQTRDKAPTSSEINRIAQTEFRKIQQIVTSCGLSASWFTESNFLSDGDKHLGDKLRKLMSEVTDTDVDSE